MCSQARSVRQPNPDIRQSSAGSRPGRSVDVHSITAASGLGADFKKGWFWMKEGQPR
jgi:hypothetical protein